MKWRTLMYDQLKNCKPLEFVFAGDIQYIYQLIITHDTDESRIKMKDYLILGDNKALKKLHGKFPWDFDDVDYPVLELILVKTDKLEYAVILSRDGKFRTIDIIKNIQNAILDKDDFEGRMLIYPI